MKLKFDKNTVMDEIEVRKEEWIKESSEGLASAKKKRALSYMITVLVCLCMVAGFIFCVINRDVPFADIGMIFIPLIFAAFIYASCVVISEYGFEIKYYSFDYESIKERERRRVPGEEYLNISESDNKILKVYLKDSGFRSTRRVFIVCSDKSGNISEKELHSAEVIYNINVDDAVLDLNKNEVVMPYVDKFDKQMCVWTPETCPAFNVCKNPKNFESRNREVNEENLPIRFDACKYCHIKYIDDGDPYGHGEYKIVCTKDNNKVVNYLYCTEKCNEGEK